MCDGKNSDRFPKIRLWIAKLLGREDQWLMDQSVRFLDSVKPGWWKEVNYFTLDSLTKGPTGLLTQILASENEEGRIFFKEHSLWHRAPFNSTAVFDQWRAILREKEGWNKGHIWNGLYKKIAVSIAAELLDAEFPYWWKRVDVKMLNMLSTSHCIIGQACNATWLGAWAKLKNNRRLLEDGLNSKMDGAFANFKEEWIEEIERRVADVG